MLENNNKLTKKMGNCPNCNADFDVGHGLQKFCSRNCKDTFHNDKKKENRLEAEFYVSQLKKEELNKKLEERVRENLKHQAIKESSLADNQLIFAGLNIPDSGLLLTINDINHYKINIGAFLQQKSIKNTPYKYLEYGDYGIFWVGVDTFLLTHTKSYLQWI